MTRTGIFLALTRYVAWSRLRRRQVRTLRLLASLPPEIRADIGWPDLYVATDGFVRLPADMALPDTGLPDTGSAGAAPAPLRPHPALPDPVAQPREAGWKLPLLPSGYAA